MIFKIDVELDIPNEIKNANIGSVMHGALMEKLPNDIADFLHSKSSYSPLKQRIIYKNNNIIWEIVSLNETLSTALSTLFFENEKLFIKRHNIEVNINKFFTEKISIEELMNKHFNEDPRRFVKFKIETPMSFKSNGQYDIYPNVKRMFRSIMLIFDTFFEEYKMYDRETLEYIEKQIHIIDYKLKTTRFHLESIKIPSFIGEVTLKIDGARTFQQLIGFLLEFGTYTGSGIKTSLGMGKYKLI